LQNHERWIKLAFFAGINLVQPGSDVPLLSFRHVAFDGACIQAAARYPQALRQPLRSLEYWIRDRYSRFHDSEV